MKERPAPVPLGVLLLAASCAAALPAQTRRYPEGVTAKVEAAIQRGLGYLVRQQQRDGSFSGATGRGHCPMAITALAGMALVGTGSSTTRGKYWKNVRFTAECLIKHAGSDGLIAGEGEHRHMYAHGFGTMFLAQVYGMETESRMQRRLHEVLSNAAKLTCSAQNSVGAWYYTADSRQEEGSVTITQVQALRACRNAGIVVPKKTIDRAVAYISRLQNSDGGIAYSMRSRSSRPGITSAAVAVLYNAGKYDDPVAAKALDFAVRRLPINGSGNGHHYYSQLYLAQALYQENGKRWGPYYKKMSQWLLRQQRKDGAWQGDSVGDIYGTSIALTILQLPYALVPIYQR